MSENLSRTKRSSQAIDNFSFDEDYLVKVTELVSRNSDNTALNFIRPATEESLLSVAGKMATKVTVSGNTTYVASAAPGSLQSSAVWSVQKIDESSGVVVTWADGNTLADNVATDLTSLTYS